ncbi:UNVERIFIED_ORG: SnoaL-like protein [Martelella mediterranea]
MTETEERNRAFVQALFAVLSEKGYGQELLDALAEDVTFHAMGKSPIAGSYHGKENYRRNALEPLQARIATSPTMEVHRILIDGDMACVQFRTLERFRLKWKRSAARNLRQDQGLWRRA